MATRTLFSDPPRTAISRAPSLAATRRRQDLLLSGMFLLMVGLPAMAMVLPIDPPIEHTDNREPTPCPALEPRWASISSFGARFQRYFEDNFGFRARLIRAHALLEARLLRVSPLSTVLWGREGWLYYADDGGTEDIISEKPFSAAELEVWRKTLVDNRNWLRARGIEYVFAIAPDKHEIYPEYLPPSIHRLGKEARMDQLTTYLGAKSDLLVVDLKTPLLAAKGRERVYDRTDTHWNRRGAYVGYRALMDAVAARVPGVEPPLPLTEFRPTRTITPGMDLAGMLRLRDMFPEESLSLEPLRGRAARVIDPPEGSPNGNEGYIVTEIPGSTRPRAVIFRDSYTSRLYPFLSEHFSRAAYYWQNDLDPDDVLKHRPAVVIHELASRHLTFLVPYDAVAAR